MIRLCAIAGLIILVVAGSGRLLAPPAASVAKDATKQTAEMKADDAKWNRDVLAVRILKASMKNPDSFRLEQALRMDDGSLCLTYRAANSFNAVVAGRAVITKTSVITSDDEGRLVATWNSRCGNKMGTVITHIRQAL